MPQGSSDVLHAHARAGNAGWGAGLMGQLLLLGSWRALQPASLERAAPGMRIAAQRFQPLQHGQHGATWAAGRGCAPRSPTGAAHADLPIKDEQEVRRHGGARLVEQGAARMGERPSEPPDD